MASARVIAVRAAKPRVITERQRSWSTWGIYGIEYCQRGILAGIVVSHHVWPRPDVIDRRFQTVARKPACDALGGEFADSGAAARCISARKYLVARQPSHGGGSDDSGGMSRRRHK